MCSFVCSATCSKATVFLLTDLRRIKREIQRQDYFLTQLPSLPVSIYGTSGVSIGLFPGKLAFQVCVMYLFRSSNVFSIHLTDTYDAQEEKNGFLARIIQIFTDFWRP